MIFRIIYNPFAFSLAGLGYYISECLEWRMYGGRRMSSVVPWKWTGHAMTAVTGDGAD